MLLFSFQCLVECRKNVCEKLAISLEDVELSMGMSNDFDKAVSVLFEGCAQSIERYLKTHAVNS